MDEPTYRRCIPTTVSTINVKYYENDVDVAFGLFTDGIQLFNKTQSECWPIMMINYNLPPEIRYKKKHLMTVGIIPGPKGPKDIDSFLHPLYEDARASARNGHMVFNGVTETMVRQRWFIHVIGGDGPCSLKDAWFKGPTAKWPCRMPLDSSHANRSDLTALDLPMRSEATIREAASEKNPTFGLSKLSSAAHLPGFSLHQDGPSDFMHAVFENVARKLFNMWHGDLAAQKSKGYKTQAPQAQRGRSAQGKVTSAASAEATTSAAAVDEALGTDLPDWVIPNKIWEVIVQEITNGAKTIPSLFARKMPNIHLQTGAMTAEDWSNWILYVGPCVLHDRLPAKYFAHFLALRRWSLLQQVMSSTGESDFPNGSGNRLYLKDTQGYKSWSQRAFINLRADKVWDVVNQSIDSLVADYRSTLVIAHATALTSVQVADKVAEYREQAIRRNDLACKYIANSISEEQMSHLIHLTSAYEMWDTLRGLHSHGRPSRTMDLLNTLAQPYSGDILFKEFVNKYDSIVGNLASDIDIHMDWNTFYPKLLMNVEMADSRNKQKKSLSARIVDDTSLVARISTTAQKDYSKSYCSRCKALGHERGWRLCPSRNKDASTPASSDSNSNVAAIGVDESALMTYTFPYSRTMPRFPWIIDSGAKVHCVGDKLVLSDIVSEPLKISVADQSQIESPGHGSVTFLTSYGARITIKRVYYMPGAQCGFISIDRLLESMTYAVGPQSNLIFSIRGKSILRSLPGRGFVMDAAPVQPIMSSSPPSMVGANRLTGTCTLMEAHRKLGHQSPAAIVLAVKSGAITGITLKDEKVTPCFSTEAPHALYRVFIDLGFVKHPNHHGDTIYLAIVDQYSTAKWTIVLKDKRAETIIEAWSKFQAKSERQTGQKIKRVRSDKGCEFNNSLFRALLEKQGIIVEFTTPYTPEQNGQVERLNGSLMGLVRSMLLDSGLPMCSWSDALAVATFILNRRPHPRIQGKTAIEVLLGKKPSLAHLQPFGSTVFVHGVFIGYSGEYNYRVWVQSSKQVYVSRHVTFLETPSVVTSSQDHLLSGLSLPSRRQQAIARMTGRDAGLM
ncbi:BQ5605_C006g04354 [Microbotryum silenes-dioicae]|uniref:BQ5605_C006g04354 protein n=1 Tax=Microbotryum silenes-dioicae TaxID=796604 RepID=A0A2X0MAW7_9BASI|nr:BQ5605_C006g04354 [Microbotryum silenes-dioicae]